MCIILDWEEYLYYTSNLELKFIIAAPKIEDISLI